MLLTREGMAGEGVTPGLNPAWGAGLICVSCPVGFLPQQITYYTVISATRRPPGGGSQTPYPPPVWTKSINVFWEQGVWAQT